MLCHASPYFVKALNGSFKEGKERKLRLPGCDPDTFERFIGYLANGQLPDYKAIYLAMKSEQDDSQRLEIHEGFQNQLISLWSFADAHLMPELQNEAMRHFLQLSGFLTMLSETASLAYEKTADGSAMRRAVVSENVYDYMTFDYHFDERWFADMGSVEKFLYDFTKSLTACKGKTCDHKDTCSPSRMVDQSRYMVPES